MYAVTNMSVKLDDGQILKFDVNRVLEVSFETSANDTTIIPPVDTSVVDITDTPLKFEILSNSTVEVVQGNYKDLNSVNIPSKVKIDGKVYNVTSIGDNTFKDCNNLASITIPKSVISIGNYAFYGCDKLTPHLLTYDNGTKCYGWVGNRDSCVNVVIPGSVTSIGDYAFYSCSGLKSITIPKKVTSIGEFAFSLCMNLDVVIENSEENVKVGYAAFNGCKSVTYTKDTSVVDITDTPLKFGILSDSTVEVVQGNYKDLDSVNIPSKVRIDGKVYNVTCIRDSAFGCCNSLTSISIPESVSSIGSWAFDGCSSLTSISIPEEVTYIGGGAFSRCDKLTPHLLTYDNGTKCYGWVGNRDSCINVVIPRGVSSIGKFAFYGCSSLTSISIPEGVTSIGSWAFDGCSSLTSISIPEGVSSIEFMAFAGCSSLTSISIPEGVTSIGYDAFGGCSSLTTISIPESVSSIESWAFYGCSSLTSISIPESVSNIGSYAFYGCSSLTTISIPESVSNIGDNAFSGCSSLTSISIPESVSSIGGGAFGGCDNLTPHLLTYDNGTKCYGWVGNRDSCVNVVIPESVSSIGWGAFGDCSNLTSISIPESVSSIGDYAFYGCSSLTSISIPESVTAIGYDAFEGCYNLDVVIENSKGNVKVGSNAFKDCKSVTYTKDTSVVDITDTPLKFEILSNSTVEVARGDYKNLDSVNIPSKVKIDGKVYNITSIGDYAFYDCSSLTSISIPESITSIEDYAFSGCSSLTSISIPESVSSIGNNAFEGCNKLTPHLLTYDNGTKCYGWVGNRDSCVNVVIPRSVTSIRASAFYGCSSLTSISIPESVTSIGDYAFYDCSRLTSISIPESVTSIGYSAFEDCSRLTSVTIPSSVTSIGIYAFYGCYNLDAVVDNVKANVEYSQSSFDGCKSVKFKDGQLISRINISLVEGSEYSVSNPSLDLSFTFKVTSATGHYTTCDQVVNLLINYKGKSTAITLNDHGGDCLIWTETEGFNVVNLPTARAQANNVVLYLTCNYNSNSDYTINSPRLNKSLKSLGALETFFVLKN